ncbi:hypothetical protein ACFL2K_03100, partial [Candidatus Margulisiibacteriota bacterium]
MSQKIGPGGPKKIILQKSKKKKKDELQKKMHLRFQSTVTNLSVTDKMLKNQMDIINNLKKEIIGMNKKIKILTNNILVQYKTYEKNKNTNKNTNENE